MAQTEVRVKLESISAAAFVSEFLVPQLASFRSDSTLEESLGRMKGAGADASGGGGVITWIAGFLIWAICGVCATFKGIRVYRGEPEREGDAAVVAAVVAPYTSSRQTDHLIPTLSKLRPQSSVLWFDVALKPNPIPPQGAHGMNPAAKVGFRISPTLTFREVRELCALAGSWNRAFGLLRAVSFPEIAVLVLRTNLFLKSVAASKVLAAPLSAEVVFGQTGGAMCFANAFAKAGGQRTCHALHGRYEGGLHQYGECDLAIVINSLELKGVSKLPYGEVITTTKSGAEHPVENTPLRSIVFGTTYFHPNSRVPAAEKERALERILDAGKQLGQRTGLPIAIRPHPSEMENPAFLEILSRGAIPLSKDRTCHADVLMVSTPSGLVYDCVDAGTPCLLIQDGLHSGDRLYEIYPEDLVVQGNDLTAGVEKYLSSGVSKPIPVS